MVGLIFGIILLVVGLGLAAYFATHKVTQYKTDGWGSKVRDGDGNYISETTKPFKKFSLLTAIIAVVLCVLLVFLGMWLHHSKLCLHSHVAFPSSAVMASLFVSLYHNTCFALFLLNYSQLYHNPFGCLWAHVNNLKNFPISNSLIISAKALCQV